MTAVERARALFATGRQFTTNEIYEELRVYHGSLNPNKVYLMVSRLYKRGEIMKSDTVCKKVVWQKTPEILRDSPTKYHEELDT